jgi:hypothetical protein
MVIDAVDAAVLDEEWAVGAVERGEVVADLTVSEVGNANRRSQQTSATLTFG